MDLTEVFALLALIVGLLTLMVDIVRLTFEVTIKLYGKKIVKTKRLTAQLPTRSQSFGKTGEVLTTAVSASSVCSIEFFYRIVKGSTHREGCSFLLSALSSRFRISMNSSPVIVSFS